MGHAPRPQADNHSHKMRKLAQEWDRLYQGPSSPRRLVPWRLLLSCASGALGFAAVIAGAFRVSPWLLTIGFSMLCVAGVIPIEAATKPRRSRERQQPVKPDLLAPFYAAYELDRITLEEFERCIDFELRKQEGLPQPREHGTLMHHGFVGADWHGTLPEFDSQGRLVGRSPIVSDYVDADYEMRPPLPEGVRFLTDEEVQTEIANDVVDSLGRPWGDQLKRVYR